MLSSKSDLVALYKQVCSANELAPLVTVADAKLTAISAEVDEADGRINLLFPKTPAHDPQRSSSSRCDNAIIYKRDGDRGLMRFQSALHNKSVVTHTYMVYDFYDNDQLEEDRVTLGHERTKRKTGSRTRMVSFNHTWPSWLGQVYVVYKVTFDESKAGPSWYKVMNTRYNKLLFVDPEAAIISYGKTEVATFHMMKNVITPFINSSFKDNKDSIEQVAKRYYANASKRQRTH